MTLPRHGLGCRRAIPASTARNRRSPGAVAAAQDRAARVIGIGRAGHVRLVRLFPRIARARPRHLVDHMVQPGVPFRRHLRALGLALVDDPAPLAAEPAAAEPLRLVASLAVIAVAVVVGADQFAAQPCQQPCSERLAHPSPSHREQRFIALRAAGRKELRRRCNREHVVDSSVRYCHKMSGHRRCQTLYVASLTDETTRSGVGLAAGSASRGREMHIARRFTTEGQDPMRRFAFRTAAARSATPTARSCSQAEGIEVPAEWSQVACDILAQKYLRKAGVPARLVAGRGDRAAALAVAPHRRSRDEGALAALPRAPATAARPAPSNASTGSPAPGPIGAGRAAISTAKPTPAPFMTRSG